MNHEGRDYAAWLKQWGIVAVLVKYRVSSLDRTGFQFPVPLLDARRVIRVTRTRAEEWGLRSIESRCDRFFGGRSFGINVCHAMGGNSQK